MAIALALSPFAQQTAELVNSGAYEAAAGSCYAIFRCLAKTCKEHEDWFFLPGDRSLTGTAKRLGEDRLLLWGVWRFSPHFDYFSCVLFGVIDKFRIFAIGRAGIYEQGKTFTIDIRTP